MYNVDSDTKVLAMSPTRRIEVTAVFATKSGSSWNDDRLYKSYNSVISAAVDIGNTSGGLQIGNAYCAKLTLKLYNDAVVNQTDRIIMRVRFYTENGALSDFISLGWFYVDTITRADKTITVTAYDKMLRAQKLYKSALTYPAPLSDILEEITDGLNIGLAADVLPLPYDAVISTAPIKGTDSSGASIYFTRREVLSYIASAVGGNFFMDCGGHMALTRFATVPEKMPAANTVTASLSEESYEVKGVVFASSGTSASRVDTDIYGYLEFANPLDFQGRELMIHALETRLVGLNYHDAKLTRQGCGWFELGDITTAYAADGKGYKILITGINYTLQNGTFTEQITSSVLSDSESNFTTGDIVGQQVPQSVAAEPGGDGNGDSYVVIKDSDAPIIMHKYTEIKYEDGLKYVYGDVSNTIICQGYIMHARVLDINSYTPVMYSVMDFSGYTTSNAATAVKSDGRFTFMLKSVSKNAAADGTISDVPIFEFKCVSENVSTGAQTTKIVSSPTMKKMSGNGAVIRWDKIFAPSDWFPNGCVYAYVQCYRDDGTGQLEVTGSTGSYSTAYIPFASMDEYNAAVGITTSPPEVT